MSEVVYTTGGMKKIDATWLRRLVVDAGAKDVGFVSVSRPEVDGDRDDILTAFPRARTLISFICPMNPAAIRSPARSVANLEFHHAGHETNEIARSIIGRLREDGYSALNPAMGFPMEMDRFPGKLWVISHKRIAEAAGLGKMGLHRVLIHPKLGNFILLGTIVTDAEITEESRAIDYNPCLECKLCVAACPVAAVKPDGRFDFSACYSHNYREFMGGFTEWVERVAESSSARDYRNKVTDPESASMWQSLSYGANYKAAYCMAVCPAGDDMIGRYKADKKAYRDEIVVPLREKQEPVYVVEGSDAEANVRKRHPHKDLRLVRSSLRPTSIAGFLEGMPLVFQAGVAEGIELDACYHFTFTGEEPAEATVEIRLKNLVVQVGHHGVPDLHVRADSRAWLDILALNRGVLGAVLTRKLRVQGPLSLMKKFQRCFPS